MEKNLIKKKGLKIQIENTEKKRRKNILLEICGKILLVEMQEVEPADNKEIEFNKHVIKIYIN
jgi:hypothetical protein